MKHQLGVLRAWAAFGISTRAWKRFFSALNALVIYSVKLNQTKSINFTPIQKCERILTVLGFELTATFN